MTFRAPLLDGLSIIRLLQGWVLVLAAIVGTSIGAASGQIPTCDWPGSLQEECRSFVHGAPIPLFDGTTLNGWGTREGQASNAWDVVDGAIHHKSGNGDLYLQTSLRDFVLHFEWRIAPGGNSGLKYRVRQYGDQWLGCEYQILDDAMAAEDNKTASLYDVMQPLPGKPLVSAATWNRSRILVAGNHIEHWLNDVLAVRVHAGSAEWRNAVAESKFAGVDGFGENREGRLFLQNHGDEVWFRNLVLIPLQECMSPPPVLMSSHFTNGGIRSTRIRVMPGWRCR